MRIATSRVATFSSDDLMCLSSLDADLGDTHWLVLPHYCLIGLLSDCKHVLDKSEVCSYVVVLLGTYSSVMA